jgi:hypothetical protein
MAAIAHPENNDIPDSIDGLANIIYRYKAGDGKSIFSTLEISV